MVALDQHSERIWLSHCLRIHSPAAEHISICGAIYPAGIDNKQWLSVVVCLLLSLKFLRPRYVIAVLLLGINQYVAQDINMLPWEEYFY